MKRQTTDWGKIVANHVYWLQTKGLVSGIQKELSKIKSKRKKPTKNPISKWI